MEMISKKAGGASVLGLALGAAMMMAQPVSAAVEFNFDKIADQDGSGGLKNEGTWISRTGSWDGGSFDGVGGNTYTKGGIGVIASSPDGQSPYLDSWSGNWGGLGVCSGSITTGSNPNQCDPSNDDNLGEIYGATSSLEELTLTFGTAVKITSLEFRDKDHGLFSGKVSINSDEYDVTDGVMNSFSGLMSFLTTYTFAPVSDSEPDKQLYLSTAVVSAVPLPAGVLLLGSALGGLGLMGRRRRKAA